MDIEELPPKKLGRVVALWMDGAGYSQQDIAETWGIAQSTLSKMLARESKPQGKTDAAIRAGLKKHVPAKTLRRYCEDVMSEPINYGEGVHILPMPREEPGQIEYQVFEVYKNYPSTITEEHLYLLGRALKSIASVLCDDQVRLEDKYAELDDFTQAYKRGLIASGVLSQS